VAMLRVTSCTTQNLKLHENALFQTEISDVIFSAQYGCLLG